MALQMAEAKAIELAKTSEKLSAAHEKLQELQRHGGRIRFRCRSGPEKSGTVFVVYLNHGEVAHSTAA